MPSSCLALPVAGQSVIEDITGLVPVDVAGAFAGGRAGCGALAEYLDQVVDRRSRQGLRYELGFLLAVVMAATACVGHDEVAAQLLDEDTAQRGRQGRPRPGTASGVVGPGEFALGEHHQQPLRRLVRQPPAEWPAVRTHL